MRSLVKLTVLALLATATGLSGVGCSSADSSDATPAANAARPGTSALDSQSLDCKTTADCAQGEVCAEGLCQVQRCSAQTFHSVSPLGKRSYFAVDREIVILNDSSTKHIDAYEALNGSFATQPNLATALDATKIVDLAAGNLTGHRPESMAIAREGSNSVLVQTGTSKEELPIGFAPIAISVGDLDDDGVDELVALSAAGDIASCHFQDKRCDRAKIDGAQGRDVTIADVDGNGQRRPVFVVDKKDGKSWFVVWNPKAAPTAEDAQIEIASPRKLRRITAGKLGADAQDYLVSLDAIDYYNDPYAGQIELPGNIGLFSLKDKKVTDLFKTPAASSMQDIAVADVNSDGKPELLILEPHDLSVFDSKAGDKGALSLALGYKSSLTATTKGSRLVFADLDGDSPAASLEGDSELTPGPLVPMTLMVYPPYSRSASDGASTMNVGTTQTNGRDDYKSVGLSIGGGIGFDIDIPLIAKVNISVSADKSWHSSEGKSRSVTVGDSYFVEAHPELEGQDNGAVVLGCGCYHTYRYRIEDPAGKLGAKGGDGKLMALFVPVGGQTTLWSLKRYNALAARQGDIPTIHVPYTIGDPSTYPKQPETLSGKPIPKEDMVFSAARPYRVSDVAKVGWTLGVSDSVSESESTGVSVSGKLGVRFGFVSLDASVSKSWDEGYTLTASRSTTFGGSVPPVRNDPKTPEDEFELYGYSFTPLVYRHKYKSDKGDAGGFFVFTHAVGGRASLAVSGEALPEVHRKAGSAEDFFVQNGVQAAGPQKLFRPSALPVKSLQGALLRRSPV